MQSIGVVRRDIEQDSKWKLGRITFSASFLHGMFNFIIFFWTLLWNYVIHKEDANDNGNDNPSENFNIVEVLQSLSLCLPVVLIGAGFYFVEAKKQRQRLAVIDGVAPGPSDSGSAPPLQQQHNSSHNTNLRWRVQVIHCQHLFW